MSSLNPFFDLLDISTYDAAKKDQRRNFNFIVEYKSQSPTGIIETQHVVVASNQLMTEQQILDVANSYVSGSKYENINGPIVGASVVGATKSQGLTGLGAAITSTLE